MIYIWQDYGDVVVVAAASLPDARRKLQAAYGSVPYEAGGHPVVLDEDDDTVCVCSHVWRGGKLVR